MKSKKIASSTVTISLLMLFTAAMLVRPDFQLGLVQRSMNVGLFQPSISNEPKREASAVGFVSHEGEERVLFENKDGEVIHLASLKGKVVFINFWATWCPPCIAEMPSIQMLYSNFIENEDVVFVMLDVDNNREKSQKFMDRRKFDLPVYTPVSAIPPDYMNGAIPTTLVLNKYGRVVFKHEGMGDFSSAEFKRFIEQLIAE